MGDMFFDIYYYIAIAAIILETLFLLLTFRNYRFVMHKYHKVRGWHRAPVCLIVPCKGLDPGFADNIASFFRQDHSDYRLWFVVGHRSDPAYDELQRLTEGLAPASKARETRILVAGPATGCSQKIHNLLYAYDRIGTDVDILAFADSDICVRPDWLSHLVWPLRQSRYGASTGYRWFIPRTSNLPSLIAACLNGKIAQLLGNMPFNQAWGGSMAVEVRVFREAGIDRLWRKALSDDLSLTRAVKRIGLKLSFVPACLVPSYDSFTWRELFEFARRQFLIARIYAPSTWTLGLVFSFLTVLGIWGGITAAVYAVSADIPPSALYIAVPCVFLLAQLGQALIRGRMIARVLPDDTARLRPSFIADILGCWITSTLLFIFIFISGFGYTIRWRGIHYKLLGPTDVRIKGVDSPIDPAR